MANTRIKDLTNDATPSASDFVAIDADVGGTRNTNLTDLVNAARPFASEAEAIAGTSTTAGMNPLATKQAIEAIGASNFATVAQGAKADTAVQPGDISTVATTGDYNDLTNKPTLGTAAAEDTSVFATAAQGTLADSSLQPSDIGTTVQAHGALLDSVSGLSLTAGDLVVADGAASVTNLAKGAEGQVLGVVGGVLAYRDAAGTGDVVGPASAVSDNEMPLFDGTTGKLIKGSGTAPGATGLDVLAAETAELARNKLAAFDTVSDLTADTALSYSAGAGKVLVAAGDIVTAQGFRYEVAASGASDEHLTTAGGVKLYVLPGTNGFNILAFGAVADGVTDDSAAIQAAFDAVPDGGSVYFPKTGGGYAGPSYYVSTALTLNKSEVTIFSDGKTDYAEGFKTNEAITVLTVTGFGLKMRGIAFWGNAANSDEFATSNALVIDRRLPGYTESASNLDAEIRDCMFFRMNIGVQGFGRNVYVDNNTFSDCKRAVVGSLLDYATFPSSEFRGWRISRNRFHGCGYPYHPASGSAVTPPTTYPALDSWCIEMPQQGAATWHIEVFDNNCDFCGGGFYKGCTSGLKIKGNYWLDSIAMFLYAILDDASNAALNALRPGVMENNLLTNRRVTSTATRGAWLCGNSVALKNVKNFKMSDNTLVNVFMDAISLDTCDRFFMSDNRIIDANTRGIGDAVARPAINFTNCASPVFNDNQIVHQSGTLYSSGIAGTGSGVKLRDNTIEGASVKYGILPTALATGADDALSWVAPTMENGYTYDAAASKGYRRKVDGTVEISVAVSAGADNTSAFTLPAGYRPSVNTTFPAVALWNTDTEAVCTVYTNGQVIVNWKAATSTASSYHLRFSFDASA